MDAQSRHFRWISVMRVLPRAIKKKQKSIQAEKKLHSLFVGDMILQT